MIYLTVVLGRTWSRRCRGRARIGGVHVESSRSRPVGRRIGPRRGRVSIGSPAPATTTRRHRRDGARAGREGVGRVHRTPRGGGRGGDPAPRLRLHQARHLRRGQGSPEGRGALRDRSPALRGRPGARRGRAGAGRAPAPRWPRARSSGRRSWWTCRRSRARSSTAAPAPSRRAWPQIRAAEAAVATAKLNLEWTRVRSPIAGRVSTRGDHRGNLVQAGPPTATLLTTVVSLDPIYCYFEGDEQTYLKYSALAQGRRPAELTRRAQPGLHRSRQRRRSLPAPGLRRLRGQPAQSGDRHHPGARGLLEQGPAVHPGLFARVKLVGSGRYRAMLVQDRAVGTDQDKKFVLVLKPDTTVEYRPVELGRSSRPPRHQVGRQGRRAGGRSMDCSGCSPA